MRVTRPFHAKFAGQQLFLSIGAQSKEDEARHPSDESDLGEESHRKPYEHQYQPDVTRMPDKREWAIGDELSLLDGEFAAEVTTQVALRPSRENCPRQEHRHSGVAGN